MLGAKKKPGLTTSKAPISDLVVLLPDIRSVHNVGSIFRTADGAGVSKIYLSGYTPAPLDRLGRLRPDFAKVALGAERTMAWEMVARPARALKKLRADGFIIIALEQVVGAVPYDAIPAKYFRNKKVCLLVGNEVMGVSRTLLRQVDVVVELPMRGEKESLNVSVAFGITIYELARRLRVNTV